MEKSIEHKKKINWFALILSFIVFIVVLNIWQLGFIICMAIWAIIYFIFKWMFYGLTVKESWIGLISIIFIIILVFLLFI